MIECMRAMGHDDMVRVVRCRDCKWWSGVPCGTATPEWCECSSILGMRAARANNFCSYGERRADDGQEALALANTNAKLFDAATARAEKAEAERDTLMKYGRCCTTCGKEKCRMAGGGINVHGCGSWEWRGKQAGKGE